MPDNNQEEPIMLFAATFVFVVLTSVVVFILLYYQKRKFKYAQDAIKMEKKYQQELLQAQLEIQEHTFNTISQEIHDNVGQVLSLAKLQVSIIEQKDTKDTVLLRELRENIGQAMTDLRDIAKSLSSERIQLLSLQETVAYEVQRINRSGFIVININTRGREQQLEQQKKLILFRIIQESIQNIIKHAQAKTVEILFNYAAENLLVTIADNGAGFDTSVQSSGLGLQNILSRATLIGGQATVSSVINVGTTIQIAIPYA